MPPVNFQNNHIRVPAFNPNLSNANRDQLGKTTIIDPKKAANANNENTTSSQNKRNLLIVAGLVITLGIALIIGGAVALALALVLAPSLIGLTIGIGSIGIASMITGSFLVVPALVLGIVRARKTQTPNVSIPPSALQKMNVIDSINVAPSQKVLLKTGYPNVRFNCWLNASLHAINSAADAFKPNTDHLKRNVDRILSLDGEEKCVPETLREFQHRKQVAILLLALLKKSRDGESISEDEMTIFLDEVNNIRFPGKQEGALSRGAMNTPCVTQLLYVLGCEQAVKIWESDEIIGFSSQNKNSLFSLTYHFQLAWDEDYHPMKIISNKEVATINEIPLFPIKFTGEQNEAPSMIEIGISGLNCKFESENDFKCLVECNNHTYCNYELSSVIVSGEHGGVHHYYSYAFEKYQGHDAWVKYDDQDVTECLDSKELTDLLLAGNVEGFIYRKCE